MSDLARLDAELKKYELAYQMTTPDFLLRVADPHDDLSDVEDASFWRATYEIAEKIRTEGDNTVSDLVARLRVNGTSLYDQAADRIESLETELAAANATIASVREIAEALKDCDCDCCIDDPTPAALLAAVLAEAKKPRLAAATMHVQGEYERVEAFLSRCDGESTT